MPQPRTATVRPRPRTRRGAPRRRSRAPDRSRRRAPPRRARARATGRPGAVGRTGARADDRDRRLARAATARPPRRKSRARRIVDRGEKRRVGRDPFAGHAESRSRCGKVAGRDTRAPPQHARVRATSAPRKRGDRPRDARDPGAATTRERQPVDRTRQELGAGSVRRGAPSSRRTRAATTRARTATDDSRRRRRGAPTLAAVASRRRDRSGRASARDSFSRYARETLRGAGAVDRGIAACTARTEIHRPDELEASRERARAHRRAQPRPRRPRAVGAATRGRSAETRQLVEEQHAEMGERSLLPGVGSGRRRRSPRVDAPWCGARNGGMVRSALPGGSIPATEWIRVTSSASGRVSGGRIPGGAGRASSCRFPAAP